VDLMSDTILADRATQLVMAVEGVDYDDARLRLERAALVIDAEADLDVGDQAALMAAAACAAKMFRGGVFMTPTLAGHLKVGQQRRRPLRRALEDLGVRTVTAPDHAVRMLVGRVSDLAPDLYVTCDGWTAQIGPSPAQPRERAGNALSGAAAGALGVAELFRKAALDDITATRQPVSINLWGSGDAPSRIGKLPKDMWLIGLGNLGQATLFVLDLLPWRDTGEVNIVLNDADVAGPENLFVQILTRHDWIGCKKARASAGWADARGFLTVIDERRFNAETRPVGTEPRLALVGVDNLDARRWAANAGFDLVIDAGLGATGPEAFDVRIHAFPGSQTADAAWPDIQDGSQPALPNSLTKLVEQGRLDICGAMTIAGTSVGVPCTALVAAALQITQACRALETGACADRIDLSLADLRRASWRMMPAPLERVPRALQALEDEG
jgi:hypothetical protein